MSNFYRGFLLKNDQTIETKKLDTSGPAAWKQLFFDRYHEQAKKDIRSLVHPYSGFVFSGFGFSMEDSDVSATWNPIEGKINIEKLNQVIFEKPSGDIQRIYYFIETFNFVGTLSVGGAMLALGEKASKVEPSHMEVAFSHLKERCPFPIEGIC